MKFSLSVLLSLVCLAVTLPCLTGCGAADQPQKNEEMRQQHIDRAKAMQSEIQQKK